MRVIGVILGGMVAATCLAGPARAAGMDAAEVHRGSVANYGCAHAHLATLYACFNDVVDDEKSKKTINDSFELGFDITEYLVIEAIANDVPEAKLNSQDRAVLMQIEAPLYIHILRIESDLGVAHADACRATITNLGLCLSMKPPSY